MPTSVTFDNAALADAVGKASRIAPKKGAAFDKAAGILFNVDPTHSHAVIKSTDLEVFYEQRVPMVSAKGDPAQWRIPSSILSGVISNLPMGDGSVVEFIDRGDPSVIRFKSGRMVAKLSTISPDGFPLMESFAVEGMTPAQALSAKVEQVSWATDPKSPLLSGVHMDGTRLIGCNQYVLAVVPCEMSLVEPVTVPLATLTALMKSATDIKIRAEDRKFEISLDAETKAWTRIIEGNYPKIDGIMREDFTGSIKCHRQQFLDTLDRLMVMVQNEKSPTLTMDINGTGIVKMLTFDMEISGTGRMQDSIDVSSDTFEDSFSMAFIPRMLQEAVGKIRGDYFTLDFGHSDPLRAKKVPVRLTDDAGYVCYVSAKQQTSS